MHRKTGRRRVAFEFEHNLRATDSLDGSKMLNVGRGARYNLGQSGHRSRLSTWIRPHVQLYFAFRNWGRLLWLRVNFLNQHLRGYVLFDSVRDVRCGGEFKVYA
jgi:hypothetical protein